MSKLSTINSHISSVQAKDSYSNIEQKGSMINDTDHPDHYNHGTECIELMLETQGIDAVLNFCTCNAFKYLYRHQFKGGDNDIQKAKWYIEKYLELKALKEANKKQKQQKLFYKRSLKK